MEEAAARGRPGQAGARMDLECRQVDRRYQGLRVLDAGRVSRIAASIAQEGQQSPVLVTADGVLVDGYHRVAALESLGRDLVLAVELAVAEAEALVLAWRLETGRRKSVLEEGWLLRELVESHGRRQGALVVELKRPRSWVSQRLGLVRDLPEASQEAVRLGRVPAQAAMKVLLPMARQDRRAVETLTQRLSEPVSVRELERLYAAWRRADPEVRQRIVEHPGLYLKADAAVSPPLDEESRLAVDLEGVAGLCRKARRQVREGVFARANSLLLRQCWQEAELAFAALTQEVRRAGSGDTRDDLAPAA